MNSLYSLSSVWKTEKRDSANRESSDATVEACAYFTNDKITITALATSNNDLILFRFSQQQEHDCVVYQRVDADLAKRISCMTFSRCGRWLVCALTCGNLEVFPTKLALGNKIEFEELPYSPPFNESEILTINCCCRDDCLSLPTCAIWYETKKKRPMIIYSNKGGDILFVDLMIRRLSVSLQAPQSIHNLDVVDDFIQNDRFLLVTGFAGSQWLVPLEQNGRSLRETLGRIVPSELRELNVRGCVSSIVESNGTKCIGILQKDHFLLFNGINFVNPVIEVILPENTWTALYTDMITFCICNQTHVAVLINQCCSTDQNLSTLTKFTTIIGTLPEGRFLGFCMLPKRSPENPLPSCLLITETGLFSVKPETNPKTVIHYFLTPSPDIPNADLLCRAFNLDFKICCFESIPSVLQENNASCALELCYLSKISLSQIAGLFVEKGYSQFILPKIESWILRQNGLNEKEKLDLSKIALNAHLALVKSTSDYERKLAEHDFKEFLSHNLWYEPESCLRTLLQSELYSVALELVKIHSLHEIFLKEVLTLDSWPISDEFLSLITCSSNTTFLLDYRSTLCLHFISRLSNIVEKIPKRWIVKILYLFDPMRTEVRRFVDQAKNQTVSVDVENFILEVVKFYLSTLFKYLFKVTNDDEKRHSDLTHSLKLYSDLNCSKAPNDERSADQDNNVEVQMRIVPLACGADHCCLLAVDGVYCWGRSRHGCLGNGSHFHGSRSVAPVRLEFPIDSVHVIQVTCGAEHTLCLSDVGLVYAWGSNKYGQLGMGDKLLRTTPQEVSFFGSSASFVTAAIYSGQYHSVVLDFKNRVYTWGWNVHGQLGQKVVEDISLPKRLDFFSSSASSPVVSVACGYAHTIFLTKSGRVYACGNNTYGQLGLNDTKKRTVPVTVPFFDDFSDDDRVETISCGFFHNLALTSRRRLWTWGATPQSLKFKALLQKRKQQIHQLQQHDANNVADKATVGACNSNTLPLTTTASNEGVMTVEGRHLKPSEVEMEHLSDCSIKLISCGYHHSCLLTDSGQLYTWGKGLEYQLGHGDKKERLTPALVSTMSDKTLSHVACGADFTVAIDDNGLLTGWGKNDYGQLGFESITESEKRKMSGKVLTIQRANKSERTIQLPQDSRVYVAKPSRIVGLRVAEFGDTRKNGVEFSNGGGHLYCKASLLRALHEFSGFYDLSDLERLCESYGSKDVLGFLKLLQGDYVHAIDSLLDSITDNALPFADQREDSCTSSLKATLGFFESICIKRNLNVQLRAQLLWIFVRKTQPLSLFDINLYLLSNLHIWASAVVFLITNDASRTIADGASLPFSLSLKTKAIKYYATIVAERENKFVEIKQKDLCDLLVSSDKKDECVVSRFSCGHLVVRNESSLHTLSQRTFNSDEFRTRFPRTEESLLSTGENTCPKCLEAELSKFSAINTSTNRKILHLL